MEYDYAIGFGLFIISILSIIGILIWVYGWYKAEIERKDYKETLQSLKEIFWTNTPMGWMWNVLFGKPKLRAKQAPPHLTNQFGHQIPMTAPPPPGPKPLTAKKAAPRGFLTIPTPPPMTHNTSSLHRTQHLIGKPLVIQNWDKLRGMQLQLFGMYWVVTTACQTARGYMCMLKNSHIVRDVEINVFSDMYDSHRVMVKCGGRHSFLDIDVFKNPNLMLEMIANEFQEKFR